MNNKPIKILAIESSCDETAAAVIEEVNNRPVILSNIISSQVDLHAKTGGVVPEVASRAHMEAIGPVITEALLSSKPVIGDQSSVNTQSNSDTGHWTLKTENYQKAILLLSDITHIAVTNGPGLIGSLLIGFNAAKSLAYAKNLPIIPINHIEGHIYSAFAGSSSGLSVKCLEKESPNSQLQTPNWPNFPILALTVSGGHTSLTLMKDHGVYEQIGQTIDDAVGEAYDKVAKLLDLGYPGGPIVSKLAGQFRVKSLELSENKLPQLSTLDPRSIVFPRPIINDGTFNFSFSGLKTAVLQKTKELRNSPPAGGGARGGGSTTELSLSQKQEISFAFEEAVADVLVKKTLNAVEKYKPNAVIFAGGVSANSYLKNRLSSQLSTLNSQLFLLVPPKEITGDNAAMIGLAAYYHIKKGDVKAWDQIDVNSNL